MVDVRPPAHPEIVPFRSAKRKRADVLALPGVNWNDAVLLLLTCPVGPWGPAAVVGMPTKPFAFTARTWLTLVLPVTAYSVLVLLPWFELQNGLVADRDRPHGFTSKGSVMVASPAMFETRFVCAYCALVDTGKPSATRESAAMPARRGTERVVGMTFTFGLQR